MSLLTVRAFSAQHDMLQICLVSILTYHASNIRMFSIRPHRKAMYSVKQTMESTILHPIRIDTFIDSSGTASTGLSSISEETRWDDSSSMCINALQRMVYNVRHNSTSIVGIGVDIETLDVEGSTRELLQEFAVNFIPVDVGLSQRSHNENNIINRVRSGNPGYVFGAPTLGAKSPTINHTSSFVIAQKAGFTVMDTGLAGQCSTSSTTGLVSN